MSFKNAIRRRGICCYSRQRVSIAWWRDSRALVGFDWRRIIGKETPLLFGRLVDIWKAHDKMSGSRGRWRNCFAHDFVSESIEREYHVFTCSTLYDLGTSVPSYLPLPIRSLWVRSRVKINLHNSVNSTSIFHRPSNQSISPKQLLTNHQSLIPAGSERSRSSPWLLPDTRHMIALLFAHNVTNP